MSSQIKPSVTTPTIADVYQLIEGGRLTLQPDFQRKFVWTQEHQEEFIGTILKGYPFPEIYVCQGEIDVIKLITRQDVIDGQQRLTTIKNYIDNRFDKPLKKTALFDSLNDEERLNFLSYQLVFRDIGRVERDVVREIFRRINLTKFKLDDVEIHNAVYDGEFISLAKSITEKIDIKVFGVFYESDFVRMADVYFILQVMATLENGGYFNADSELEEYISKFNDEYPNRNDMGSKILRTLLIVRDDLKLEPDSIWYRKSAFFTLIVELAKNLDKVDKSLTDKLIEFEQNILSNKSSKNDYGVFYSYIYQGTVGRKARVERARVFMENIF